jgi:cysteine desulfuration protein SufE
MQLQQRQAEWIEEYGFLPDPQERFTYVLEQSAAAPGLAANERADEALVPGCMSKVWIVGEPVGAEGVREFRSDADAPMVKAMAWLLCRFYSGVSAQEIAATEPEFLSKLRLLDALTENRRRGVAHMVTRIRRLAAASPVQGAG